MTLATRPVDSRPEAGASLHRCVMTPQLAALIDAARDAAWQTHANVAGVRYYERKDSMARLRGALAEHDRVQAEAA